MPPAVLHVAQPTDAGVGAYVAAVAADQVDRGWTVTVACPPDGPLTPAVGSTGAAVLPWLAGRNPGPGLVSELRGLARVIERAAPDVVHLHSSKAGLVGRLLTRSNRPVLFQPHGWSWLAAGRLLEPAVRRWERLGARWAGAIVCVSAGERDEGVRAGVAGRYAVVRNGVEVQRFAGARSEAARRAARGELGLDEGPVVACVGRLSRQKGQDRLVEAWPQVVAAHPGATLLLVGDGPERQRLSRPQPGLRICPGVDDVRTHLAAADLVVLSSRWEGLSLAMLEALAAGRPVVTTAVAGSEVLPAGAGVVLRASADDDPAVAAELAGVLRQRLGDAAGLAAAGAAAATFADAELDVRRTHDELAALTSSLLQPF
jgi:glycosyltransferase involved in cell wall biosynthesis